MLKSSLSPDTMSEFVQYLVEKCPNEGDRLPSLAELSQELGLSVASLREQMEVARVLGFVEVKPRVGMRILPYSFSPAVHQSLTYALMLDPKNFQAFSDLRGHIEAAYWHQAVGKLGPEDHQALRDLIDLAMDKLHGPQVQIPHKEHRELHLSIYKRLDNPFVQGILEAYWDMYEAFGLAIYNDYAYLEKVWHYHQDMVEAICRGDIPAGYQALVDHMNLLGERSPDQSRQKFE
jgi:DNA-binding FadR family transcriptional regulator